MSVSFGGGMRKQPCCTSLCLKREQPAHGILTGLDFIDPAQPRICSYINIVTGRPPDTVSPRL